MKEFKDASKNKWMEMLRKRWFFPALYLIIATVLISAFISYQSIEKKLQQSLEDSLEQTELGKGDDFNEEAESVVQQQEVIMFPVPDYVETEIVTKFFDYNETADNQEKSLTLYNKRYYQSSGVNIKATDGGEFDVVAALSGTVTEVKEDPLLGNIVMITHEDDITTYYASLGSISVEAGTKVVQGDKIGSAGKNIFNEPDGTHVQFEIHHSGKEINPELAFNQEVGKLVELNSKTEDVTSEEDDGSRHEESEEEHDNKNENNDDGAPTNQEYSLSKSA